MFQKPARVSEGRSSRGAGGTGEPASSRALRLGWDFTLTLRWGAALEFDQRRARI